MVSVAASRMRNFDGLESVPFCEKSPVVDGVKKRCARGHDNALPRGNNNTCREHLLSRRGVCGGEVLALVLLLLLHSSTVAVLLSLLFTSAPRNINVVRDDALFHAGKQPKNAPHHGGNVRQKTDDQSGISCRRLTNQAA
ncbi:hypothetical protein TcasGA2_TC013236 [Tribolium castaneum]|uniref:Transmembrane protein n=1 Tax=Tribolium castaneum TaxID=7070 RepID=D6WMH5_TRICA|nr:hypothetical protein TcasGA2_TC013236 [Tribolium castaneum]